MLVNNPLHRGLGSFGIANETTQQYCERTYGSQVNPDYYNKCMRPGLFEANTWPGQSERGLPSVFDVIGDAARKGFKLVNGVWQKVAPTDSGAWVDTGEGMDPKLMLGLGALALVVLITRKKK